jgi:hypothetical protein
MESYDYRADCLGLWTWPKQWFRLRPVVLQTGAGTCHGQVEKLLRKGSALSWVERLRAHYRSKAEV